MGWAGVFVGRSCSPFLQSIAAPPLLGGMGGGSSFQLSCITAALHSSPTHGFFGGKFFREDTHYQLYPKAVNDQGAEKKVYSGRYEKWIFMIDEGGANIGIEHRLKNLKHFLPGRSEVSQEGLVDS